MENHFNQKKKAAAWAVMLASSTLPDIFFTELTNQVPAWLLPVKLFFLGGLIVISLLLKKSGVRVLAIVLFAVNISQIFPVGFSVVTLWEKAFGEISSSFTAGQVGVQTQKIFITLLLIGFMFLLGFKRKEIFLDKGNPKASIRPVRWLGFPEPDPWTHFGGQWAIYISLGTLVFLVLGGRPSIADFQNALPLAPLILLFAALNAFSEEVTYRSVIIGSLEKELGSRQSVWIAAAYFGLAHYYGVPYGFIGVAMSTFLGWMLGKAMVETRGMFWAWLIHFLQDVLIFTFMAAGAVSP